MVDHCRWQCLFCLQAEIPLIFPSRLLPKPPRPWQKRLTALFVWGGLALGSSAFCLVIFQALFGRQLEQLQTIQLGRDLALNVRLTELALERYPPHLVAELTGLDLKVVVRPKPAPVPASAAFKRQADALQLQLCQRLSHCPMVLPDRASRGERSVWIELISPLEPIWLRVDVPSMMRWPPEPTLLGLSLVGAGIICGGLFLLVEVEAPLRGLEKALSRVGDGEDPDAVPARGAPEVQRLTQRFNAMVRRLAANRRERATMLAGIAHDLRAPITRLQFRLSMPQLSADERERCAGDLQSLERITGQFLLFAGGGDSEASVDVPLDQLLAEVASSHSADQLRLDLAPLSCSVKPVALGRAIANLIDNAFSYGIAPVILRLHLENGRCCIDVWDQGQGMPSQQWEEALQPFHRLDSSRGQQGHCGLGLAIVSHVARLHGGRLECIHRDDQREGPEPGRFAIRFSLPFPDDNSTAEKG